jgi:membrane-bound lytic murein transglycosylase D
MIKQLLILLTAVLIGQAAWAQPEDQPEPEQKLIISALDSLASLYFFESTLPTEYPGIDSLAYSDPVPVFPDSIYANRIARIQSPMPYTYNDDVAKFINLYNARRRRSVQKMLGMKDMYFPMFEETLDKYGIPLELKYLAIIESALNTQAVSRVGATGLWQFMYNTGKLYDLEINSYIDERRDPVKATDAACRYLKKMYSIYGDWFLVIAAYNCGPGNVNKAIRRSGGKTDFWGIKPWLPRETSGYVPAFIAASYIFMYHEEHGLQPLQPKVDITMLDTVLITRRTSITKVAKYLDMNPDEVAFLNPGLKQDVIPAFDDPYPLKLPIKKLAAFDEYADSIYYESPAVVAEKEATATLAKYTPPSSRSSYDPSNKTLYTYTVKSGDNLGFIADWYDISVQEIKNANNIYGTRIRVGQKLKIYVPKGRSTKYARINSMSFAEKQALDGKKSTPAETTKTQTTPKSGNYIYHKVRSGDTLWDIAKLYPGNSIDTIKRLNGITDGKSLKPGMVIKIAKNG